MNALCLQSDQNKSQNVLKTLHRMSKQVPLGRQLGMKHLHLALNLNTNLSLQYKNIIFLGKAGVGFLPSKSSSVLALVLAIAKGSIAMDVVTVSAHPTNPIQLSVTEGEKQIYPRL